MLRDLAGNLAGPCPLSLISTLVWQKPSRPAGPEHAQPGEPGPTRGYSLPSQPTVIQLCPVLQLLQPTLAPSIFSGFLPAFFCSDLPCPLLILSTCRCHPHAFVPSLPLLLRLSWERWRDWVWPRAQPREHTQYELEGRAVSGEGHRQDHSLSSTLRGPGHMPGVRLSSAGVAEVWTPRWPWGAVPNGWWDQHWWGKIEGWSVTGRGDLVCGTEGRVRALGPTRL